jgi:hypothetical protein
MEKEDCPYHIDHENRIKSLEHNMEEVKNDIKKQIVTVAMISFCGVIFTALTSFAGVVFTAFLKSKGVF